MVKTFRCRIDCLRLSTLELRTEKAIVRKWHAISGTIIQYGGPAARDGRVVLSGQYIESIRHSSATEFLADELELTMRSKHHQFSKILKVKFFLSNAIPFSVLGSRVRRYIEDQFVFLTSLHVSRNHKTKRAFVNVSKCVS